MIDNEILKELYKSSYDLTDEKLNAKETTLESNPLLLDAVNYEIDREFIRTRFINNLTNIKDINNKTEVNLENLNERIDSDLDYLNYKISKAVEKLRGAILSERNTTSTIYSSIIPITEQEANQQTTTATIKDNIVFGISSSNIENDLITPLTLQNLSFKNLEIKTLNKKYTENLVNFNIGNKDHNSVPLEFTIDLRGLIKQASLLVLKLKDISILEIYINGNLIREKELNNYFNIPVDLDTQSVGVRAYPTLHKSSTLNFDILGISELIYQEESIFETKQIPVNRQLTNIVIDTCDNAFINEVDIEYFISLNNSEYEKINPVTKQSGKYKRNIQSIIALSKDKELSFTKLKGLKRVEGDIRYNISENLQNFIEYEIEIYYPNPLKKFKTEYYILIKEDVLLNKQASKIIQVDNLETEDNILLLKGIRKISLSEINEINYQYIENIIGKDNIYLNVQKTPIYKEVDGNKYISLTIPEIISNTEETTIPDIYIKGIKQQIDLTTLKLKVVLKSLNQKTTPYVSRILLRGI